MYDVSVGSYPESCKATQRPCSICGIRRMLPREMDHCCWEQDLYIPLGSFSSCQSKKKKTIKNDFFKFYFIFLYCQGGANTNHTVSTCSQENGRTSMFMHFFIVHMPDSVTFYIPHWSCLCVWTGMKGVWRIEKRILQPLAT